MHLDTTVDKAGDAAVRFFATKKRGADGTEPDDDVFQDGRCSAVLGGMVGGVSLLSSSAPVDFTAPDTDKIVTAGQCIQASEVTQIPRRAAADEESDPKVAGAKIPVETDRNEPSLVALNEGGIQKNTERDGVAPGRLSVVVPTASAHEHGSTAVARTESSAAFSKTQTTTVVGFDSDKETVVKGRPLMAPAGALYAVPSEFIERWRKWIRRPTHWRRPSVVNPDNNNGGGFLLDRYLILLCFVCVAF